MKKVTLKDFDENEFYKSYPIAKNYFENSQRGKELYELLKKTCLEGEILNYIVFCNNVYEIPPIKTWMILYIGKENRLESNPNDEERVKAARACGRFFRVYF